LLQNYLIPTARHISGGRYLGKQERIILENNVKNVNISIYPSPWGFISMGKTDKTNTNEEKRLAG
jgi:hypothetical protein